MTEILSLSLLYGCNENMSIKNKKKYWKMVGTRLLFTPFTVTMLPQQDGNCKKLLDKQ